MKTLEQARALRLACLQIFSGNPRGWRQKPLDAELAAAFASGCRETGLEPGVVHAPYLINLASPDPRLWRKSLAAMGEQLSRAKALGARAVVVHPGSGRDRSRSWAEGRLREAVRHCLAEAPPGVELWLENTAGAKNQLGGRLAHLARVLAAFEGAPVAACLDTAHAFGAGYPLGGKREVDRFLARVDRLLGLSRVKLWHLNDSLRPLGSHRDQHADLGKGLIGCRGLAALVRHPRLRLAPAVIERPREQAWSDQGSLAYARRLEKGR